MIELPAGKYQITNIEFRAGVPVGPAYVDLSTSHRRTVEFEVVSGQVVYLGDLLVDDQGGFYSGVAIKALSVRDMYEMDKPLFAKSITQLDSKVPEKKMFNIVD